LVWERLIRLHKDIELLFDSKLDRVMIDDPVGVEGFEDSCWESHEIRKCHVQKIDRRDESKLWLMHVNIFPVTRSGSPILGFDIVSGKNKITGAFFDYSPVREDDPMLSHFRETAKELKWNKPRDLPEWASKIFSDSMIAVGNINTDEEIEQLTRVCYDLTKFYVDNVEGPISSADYTDRQNMYCAMQKMNPHLHRSMLSMGFTEEEKNRYIERVLFEEI
jgi:phycocyanobilin:ferredoxin oxidoreductase